MIAALAPQFVLALTALAVILVVSARRHLAAAVVISSVGLALAAASVPLAARAAPRAVGVLFTVDGLSLFVTALVSLLGLAIGLLAHAGGARGRAAGEELHVLLVLAVLGASVLAMADHAASLLLGIELLGVSLYGLIAYPVASRGAVEAGMKYLVLAGVASAVLVFGLACIYADTGTLDLVAPASGSPLAVAGMVLVLVGLLFKLALVPLHMWTPDVYTGAPAPVTALVATVSKGAVLAVTWRWLAPATASGGEPAVTATLIVAGVASMLVGNLLALRQRNVKRLLGCSSIAHLGYLVLALTAGAEAGRVALVFYLAAYTLTMTAALGVVGTLRGGEGDADTLDHFRGLFWRRPGPAMVMGVALLSLAGIPLTAGFLAKIHVLGAGVGAARWWLVAGLVIGSAMGIYYYLRVLLVMADRGDGQETATAPDALPMVARWVLAVLTGLVLLLGLVPAVMQPVTAMATMLAP